jgi:sugar O-acyltransferase (sialic acid O-acetyltransferase NeuD family)
MGMIPAKTLNNGLVVGRDQAEQTALTIAIYGGGGFAREVLQLVKDLSATGVRIACAGFLVDPGFPRSGLVSKLPVLGKADWLEENKGVPVTVAIGSPAARRRISERIEQRFGSRIVTLIHPRATIGDTVSLGSGAIACTGSVATTDILIGVHVQMHVNCTIGHDAVIGNFATVCPGANIGGAVEIGEGAFLGSGATILPRCKIGEWSIVAAGSVVTADVPSNSTVAGVPAKVIARHAAGWHLGNDHQSIERSYLGRQSKPI